MRSNPLTPVSRLRRSTLLAVAACSVLLAGCGSSAGSDGAATTETTAATTTTTAPATTETTISVTTTNPPSTTTTIAAPSDLTPEETAVAFVRAVVEGQATATYVRDPAVATDAERQLGEMGGEAYDSIALDPARSQQESGAPDQCAVNDVTFTCYVLIDRSSEDSGGASTLLAVGVAVNDLTGVTSPEDVGPRVPAHVVSVEVVPA